MASLPTRLPRTRPRPGPLRPELSLQAGIVALLCLASLLSPVAAGRGDKDQDDWREAEHEMPTTIFPASFVDSLREVNRVGDERGLRVVDTPLRFREEKLVYEVAWGPLKAGFGIMEHHFDSAANLLYLSVKGTTNKFVGTFYTVRDMVRSTIDAEGLYPVFFEEHIEEGRYRAKRWALYDHREGMVHTSKKKHEHMEAPPFSQDFMSLLYLVRAKRLAPGDTFSIDCFVHGKNYPVFFECGPRKRITVDAGTFDCVAVNPRMVGKGRTFSKGDKLTLWMTDDDRHIPVLVRSKIKLGSITGKLIYHE